MTTRSPDINAERVKLRVRNNGHGVPEDKIYSRYERTTALLPEILSAADEGYVYDNSSLSPSLTFLKTDNIYYNCSSSYSEVKNWVSKHIALPLEKAGISSTTADLQDLAAIFKKLKLLK